MAYIRNGLVYLSGDVDYPITQAVRLMGPFLAGETLRPGEIVQVHPARPTTDDLPVVTRLEPATPMQGLRRAGVYAGLSPRDVRQGETLEYVIGAGAVRPASIALNKPLDKLY